MVNEQSDNQKKRERIVIETGSSMIDRAHIDNAIQYPEIEESAYDEIITALETIESLEFAIEGCWDSWYFTWCTNRQLEGLYNETKNEIAVMASILRNHGIYLRPQKTGYEPKRDPLFPDDNESLYQRYFIIKESLFKIGAQLLLRKEIKMIQSDLPYKTQDELMTKEEAVSWMRKGDVDEADIFRLLGEKPPKADNDNLPSTITNEHNDKIADESNIMNENSGSSLPGTIESLREYLRHALDVEYCIDFDHDILERWCNEAKDELVVTASILRDNGMPYDPKSKYDFENIHNSFPVNDGLHHSPEVFVFLRRFRLAKRESLRKNGDQLVLRKETTMFDNDKPCEVQEEVITKKEAVEWLQDTGATDAEIFGITGERPEAVGEGLLRSTISENNMCKGNRVFVAR